MELYLLRHAQAQSLSDVTDPYSAGLTPAGHVQAEQMARACAGWGVQFLCTSTMRCAQQTADAIEQYVPGLWRWDLQELEDLTIDDLQGAPSPGPLVSTWSTELLRKANEQAWIRVMAAWARVLVYSETHRLQRVAILAHLSSAQLLLLNWLGLDWRSLEALSLTLEPAASAKVVLGPGNRVCLEWWNRPT